MGGPREARPAIKGASAPGRNPRLGHDAPSPAHSASRPPGLRLAAAAAPRRAASTPPDERASASPSHPLLTAAGVGCPGSTTGDATLPAARAPTACSVCGGSRGSGLGGLQSPLPHNRIQNPVLDFFYLPFQNFLFWHPPQSISIPFDFDCFLLLL